MPGSLPVVLHKGKSNVYYTSRPKMSKFKTLYKAGNRRKKSKSSVMRIPSSPPTNGFVKFRYVDKILSSSDGALSLPGVYQFRLNSIYDPNITNSNSGGGGGHQPLMRDQIMGILFNNYRVIGATVKIRGMIDQSSTMCIYGTYDNTSSSDEPWKHIEETNNKFMRYYNKSYLQPYITFKKYFPINELFGITKEQFRTSGDFSALYSTSPSSTAYFNIVHQCNTITTTSNFDFLIEIIYHTQLFNPLDITQS